MLMYVPHWPGFSQWMYILDNITGFSDVEFTGWCMDSVFIIMIVCLYSDFCTQIANYKVRLHCVHHMKANPILCDINVFFRLRDQPLAWQTFWQALCQKLHAIWI